MITYAVDSESYYDKECSIKIQGVWGYLRHPACDVYMISVVGDNGYKWVGHPKDLNWNLISGPGTRWVMHNAQFDMAVIQRLKELEIMPDVEPEQWYCTADLAAYHGLPRSLKGACESALKGLVEVSKDTRNAMNGQRWENMTPEFQKEVSEYALHDSVCCLMLWQRLSPTWPAVERVISQHTAMISFNGIPVNVDKIDTAIQTLKDQIWEAEGKIPWAGKHPTLSPKQLAEECRKVGIDPPRSLAQDSEECALWEDTYGKQYPWVDAMRTYRRCNALMKKYQSMKIRTRPDNRMDAGLLYCGAHTLRDSGSGGVNLQNMPRDEMFGTNMRECIEAPPGKTFVINDLSQIEPRVLAWLAGDKEFIKLLAAGFGPYEAHARATLGWTGGKLKAENPSMYSLSKARCVAEGTLILTSRGYKEIQNLTIDDQIWDGLDFVSHDGIINSGYKKCIPVGSEYFTDDHLLFTADDSTNRAGNFSEGYSSVELYRETSSAGWSEVWALGGAIFRCVSNAQFLKTCLDKMSMRLWKRGTR